MEFVGLVNGSDGDVSDPKGLLRALDRLRPSMADVLLHQFAASDFRRMRLAGLERMPAAVSSAT